MPGQDHRRRTPRRLLLVGAGAALLAPLSGCRVRLEDDAPRVPLLPSRTPVPEEERLTALSRGCQRLAALADGLGGTLGAQLTVAHRRQHTVVRTALLAAGVPADTLDLDPGAGSSSQAPDGPRAVLARAEAAGTATAARFAEVDEDLRVPLASLHAQRYAAATLLGASPRADGEPVDADVVDDLGRAVETSAYLLEVAGARSSGAARRRAALTVRALRRLRTDLATGREPAEPVLGVPLPYRVRTDADASRLAADTLSDLRATIGQAAPRLLATDPASGAAAVTRWLGTAEAEAHRWGVPLEPFPGLS
ncbi:hypothetical protein H9L10_07805 [Phycicoccus endophyticus]|uniref:DUF4439 domain-containing protein n=1 Tax=Phycicoccus endophyticus TaxID=1690220 RepID=A0A7G9R5D8_9MICO|nr:hypothetical protein [Phycicoccus endophyticus]NHI19150.1 hypothetical protein [Phycicoccus endophyticus]QNN50813.1 hypothetical protein H9L10_07805 [Phycicoccus endophyticus]GGL40531.1 hypothetical protein GCM10012283_23850 [Phycicoccus endophyticus]